TLTPCFKLVRPTHSLHRSRPSRHDFAAPGVGCGRPGEEGYVPTLLGLSVMLPALFGAVLVHHPMFWPTPPASLDWAWACLRWLARSRCFCVSRSERCAANETAPATGEGRHPTKRRSSCGRGSGCD